jgi:hypothetical protein
VPPTRRCGLRNMSMIGFGRKIRMFQ